MVKKKHPHHDDKFVATKIHRDLHNTLWMVARKVSPSHPPKLNDGLRYALKAAQEKYEQDHPGEVASWTVSS